MTNQSEKKNSHLETQENLCVRKNIWFEGLKKFRQKINHPILPKVGANNVLITSALPYVNNIPHLGNIIGCVLSADCYARYCRLRGYQTLYICGTDEYGTATETKAREEGLSCEEICEKYHKIHRDVYQWFNISFDHFGRTTNPHHKQIAQDIFLKLYNNKFLVEDSVEQFFCEKCQIFLADRYIEGECPFCLYNEARGDQCDKCGKLINSIELKNPKCKICQMDPIIRRTQHLFLDLPKIEPKLKEFIAHSQLIGKWTHNAISITKGWINDGLKPRCITRDLKWGTPVPLDKYKDKVLYVWFDAPIGYISITADYTDHWKQWWKNSSVRLVNFMAKDNVPFHTVIFPSTLLATNDDYICITDISSTEYLNYEKGKFSKSRGIGIFGNDAMDTIIKPDIFRLYLLSNRPETQDSDFMWNDLIVRNSNEIINNIGNFINRFTRIIILRCLSMLYKKFDGKIQTIYVTSVERALIEKIDTSLKLYIDCMESEAYSHFSDISHGGNQYIQHTKPWELKIEDPNQLKELGSILSFSANIVALLALLMEPYAPEVSEKIRSDIKLDESRTVIPDNFVQILPNNTCINKPAIYFTKIDPKYGETLKQKYGTKSDITVVPTISLLKN
ncbi:hypothetical protein HZS_2614 [Henneguya salminicola]|nr:hypothetical protein HZS_2614 [Henneguya salminicola]